MFTLLAKYFVWNKKKTHAIYKSTSKHLWKMEFKDKSGAKHLETQSYFFHDTHFKMYALSYSHFNFFLHQNTVFLMPIV